MWRVQKRWLGCEEISQLLTSKEASRPEKLRVRMKTFRIILAEEHDMGAGWC